MKQKVKTRVHSLNGFDLDVLGATVDAIKSDREAGLCTFRGRNHWQGGACNRTTISDFHAAKQELSHEHPFELEADEPCMLAGGDGQPNPVEHLLNALAGCVTTSMAAHAAVQGIEIEGIETEVEGDIDIAGFLGICPNTPKGYTEIRLTMRVNAAPEDIEKLKELAAYSPVYNTLTQGTNIEIDVKPK